ncbi:hypothetical protein [Butyrivibrio sp.]|nr:hypothetical protein [Butyrivibrio sp.]
MAYVLFLFTLDGMNIDETTCQPYMMPGYLSSHNTCIQICDF